jgi:cellulose synthase/poly-beta-1,6-N-acetylglucosamine synthase-like glycosyltransferase
MIWLFWISIAFIFYTLAGYRALLWIVTRVWRKEHRREPVTPRVTVIIVVHNESATITDKIRNTLAFSYPTDKLEVIVGSDGSTDDTANVVRSFADAGVKLVESPERKGKHRIQMLASQVAGGEILVFTDASIRAEPDVLIKMVSHFADPGIGCVASVDAIGKLKEGARGELLYVSGEMGLRWLETQVGSSVSLSGSLFAVRRQICDAWHPDMSSDFFLALHAVERGYRVVIDPECTVRLSIVKSQKAEMTRKVRTIVHGLVVFFSHLRLLNPFRYGLFSWQLISHKLFRWLLPFAFLAALISNVFLWKAGIFYKASLVAQLAGYSAALISFFEGRLAKSAVVNLAVFFVIGNVATLVAWWKFCQGERFVTWEPSRRD